MEHNLDRLIWGAGAVALFALMWAIMKVAFPDTLQSIVDYWNSLIP